MINYIRIGKIVAAHGIGGEIIITHVLNKKCDFKNIQAIFVEEQKQSYIPYFIEKASARSNDETVCKLENINTKEAAHRFIKKNVWLSEADFTRVSDDKAPVSLLGYMVYDDAKPLSKVEEIIEQPHQILLKINMDEKEVYIPLHEETLNKIDRKKQSIHVTLPEGLLDIYLNE